MRFAMAAACLSLSWQATAHQLHFSRTEINWNSKAQSVEVIAALHADDIEAMLRAKTKKELEVDRDKEAEPMICEYTRSVLELREAGDRAVTLNCIGMKVAQHFIEVYLEGRLRSSQPPASLRNRILAQELPDQTNQVVLQQDNKAAGPPMLFLQGDGWKRLNWPERPAKTAAWPGLLRDPAVEER